MDFSGIDYYFSVGIHFQFLQGTANKVILQGTITNAEDALLHNVISLQNVRNTKATTKLVFS